LHGFAFVEMAEPEAARLAAQRLNGRTLYGSRLIVYTVPPRSRPRTAPRT
jgi:RNA recognition motif-containing protein